MEHTLALQILGDLADGRDPFTGTPLAADHLCQRPQIIRALCLAVQELRQLRQDIAAEPVQNVGPENAGKPWTAEEEVQLVKEFEAGGKLGQLARKHGRTRQAIQGRLYRLGKVPQWQLGVRRGGANGE